MVKYDFPCKAYTKHYLEFCFGSPVIMRNDSYIGKNFYRLVEDQYEHQDSKLKSLYDSVAVIIITQDVHMRKGFMLSKSGVAEFNHLVEDFFKKQINAMLLAKMDSGVEINLAINNFIYPTFRMDESIMTHECIRKDFQRYRKKLEAA